MSSYGLPGASPAGSGPATDTEANQDFQSLLAQLRRQSSPSPGPGGGSSGPGPDMLPPPHGQYGYNNYAAQPYYAGVHHSGSDSPNAPNPSHVQTSMDSPAFLPEAPTPPVSYSHSQYPPGLMSTMNATRAGPPAPSDDRTAHLLNLLKYNSQNGPPSTSQQASREPPLPYAPAPIGPPPVIHAPAPAAADPTGLLAALMKGTLPETSKPEPPSTSTWNQGSPPTGTQQYLLNLLNRPKPSQHGDLPEAPQPPVMDEKDAESSHGGRSAEPTLVDTLASRSELDYEPKSFESPPPKFDSTPHSQHSHPVSKPPVPAVFPGFQDAYDHLSGSSPIHRTPKTSTTPSAAAETAHPVAPVPTQILKKPTSVQHTPEQKRSIVETPEHLLRKPEHSASPGSQGIAAPIFPLPAVSDALPVQEKKESVADAVSGLAEQADREAREALARAEYEQAQARELEPPAPEEAAPAVLSPPIAGDLASKQQGDAFLASTLDVAVGVKEEKDSGNNAAAPAAHGPVADSWESAEAEEAPAPEEPPAPVTVYNFPMKPWISISLQEIEDTRPVFREEAILDIARLKKDFDQMDRNLVSASETYMAYGMSKAGGLRVIRQEDGKDAKLFTDTKDRIFNVAISTSAAHQHPGKEAIIGTGVSGTVYWVQLKNGDRDHLEDPHPEQYGFALPPIQAQEGGDAPGGVLKTRARPSSMHPEYFAVGRGKSINIIWPSFIFENNLFKTGHDRVVDTDRLMKQCSLKINTGKAGKDFTFSQDDTVVVSLDKSGRVKFWDVRELTAPKEGSDLLSPLPAHTSFEVKEPLMTLTTTPEGEKAWPTSVLLLDKFRPYQKRVALRYMIVGMKQNHTLQLWDLALGKPVQEFNFPHNKESDAVCSVMYHAASNMIVVGHPTRNSIYFLHLSAPKYNLKNMSQVEYIQRLVAQDPSIPQPESTAVISGIREYSFANKGVLRSLNILENPAASGDGEEPTLFELYAMHSKGVTCLFIKQAELGWSRENKVISPADAVESGLAKISKLVPPPPPPPAETQHANAPTESAAPPPPQIRIATRNKDAGLKIPTPPSDEKTPKSTAAESGSTLKTDQRKDNNKEEVELPVPAPERTERKGRKKKSSQQAAAAVSNDHPGANAPGESNNNRATLQNNKAGKGSRNMTDNNLTDAKQQQQQQQQQLQAAADLSLLSSGVSQEHLENIVNKMESRIVANISGRFDAVFNEILKQMQTFQDSRDSAFANNQSTLLQMVADVLNDNTEAVLKNLIISQINDHVIPSLRSTIDKSVADQLGAKTSAQIGAVKNEVSRNLNQAVANAMMKPDVAKTITERIVHNLAITVSSSVEKEVQKSISTLASNVAKQTAHLVHQRILEDVDARIREAFQHFEERRRDDDTRLDRLMAQTQELADIISTLAASQTQLQRELVALRQQISEQGRERAVHLAAEEQLMHGHGHHARGSASSHTMPGAGRELVSYPHSTQASVSHQQAPHVYAHQPQHQYGTPEQQQVMYGPSSREERQKMELNNLLDTIDGLMRSGNYSDAMLRWLQSGDRTEEIFQQVLSNYNPMFAQDLPPLVLLSVGATVSRELSRGAPKLTKKISLLEIILYSFNQHIGNLDDQVRDVTPKIMRDLKSRIEQLLLDISRIAPHDPSIKTLSGLSQLASRIAESVQSVQVRHASMHGPVGHMGAY